MLKFPVYRPTCESLCLSPQYKSRDCLGRELLQQGDLFASPGGEVFYRVAGGPVCLLYDREGLPWPCCSLEWRGKQPSWRRIGRRLIPDIGGKYRPCYAVEQVGGAGGLQVKVLSWVELDPLLKCWWYSIEMNASNVQHWRRQGEPPRLGGVGGASGLSG